MTNTIQITLKDMGVLDATQDWCIKTKLFLEDKGYLTKEAKEVLMKLYSAVDDVIDYDWNKKEVSAD